MFDPHHPPTPYTATGRVWGRRERDGVRQHISFGVTYLLIYMYSSKAEDWSSRQQEFSVLHECLSKGTCLTQAHTLL